MIVREIVRALEVAVWAAAVILLALAALEAGAQTFPVPGPGHAPWVAVGGGGGGIAGVEKACSDSGLYGSGGNCVCSEMMNEAATVNSATGFDFPGSPDAWECWGNRPGAADFTIDQVPQVTESVASDPAWGSIDYAYVIRNSAATWAQAPLSKITSATRTFCMRFVQQVSDPFPGTGGDASNPNGPCPNTTWRNKVMQMNFVQSPGGQVVNQLNEKNTFDCPTPPAHNNLSFYAIDENGGQVEAITGDDHPAWSPSGSRTLDRCDSAGCSFQWCVDGNVLAGTNLNFRARLVFKDTNQTFTAVSSRTINYDGGPTNQSTFGGDWWDSGVIAGGRWARRGLWTVFAWDTDSDQWIPEPCEISGGC